jgi:hypothetical protein
VASHGQTSSVNDKVQLAGGGIAKFILLLVGVVGLLLAGFTAINFPGADAERFGLSRFYHAYLTGFMYVLSIALGGLFFTLIQHLVAAGWSTNVRRIAETFAMAIPVLAIFSIPILVTVARQDAMLYPWAIKLDGAKDSHGHGDEHGAIKPVPSLSPMLADAAAHSPAVADAAKAVVEHDHDGDGVSDHSAAEHDAAVKAAGEKHDDHAHSAKDAHGKKKEKAVGYHTAFGYKDSGDFTVVKQPWLSSWFFIVRIVGYFTIWSLIAWYFYSKSRQLDDASKPEINKHLRKVAPVCILAFALSVTFAAFDLVMSLDHHWFSTMFGVYFFAGSMIATFAAMIVTLQLLQRNGYLTESVTTEHYHDLGKFMFAFVFFWAYVGFSQYMLQWYASIPEATPWWARRGATSAAESINTINVVSGYGTWSLLLLFGHLIIPFPYLLSRHIKRSREALLIGACWMLVMHFVDLFWLIGPELDNGKFFFGAPEIAAVVGFVGIFGGFVAWKLGTAKLRPVYDPRTPESLAFHNI